MHLNFNKSNQEKKRLNRKKNPENLQIVSSRFFVLFTINIFSIHYTHQVNKKDYLFDLVHATHRGGLPPESGSSMFSHIFIGLQSCEKLSPPHDSPACKNTFSSNNMK